MTETKTRRATFADLVKQNYEFEIAAPGGESLTFEMEPLSPGAMLDISRTYPEPDVPIKDIRPNAQGGLSPVYDYENAGYKVAREAWARQIQGANILRCLVGEMRESIPGETEAEQIAYLVENTANWAYVGLYRASQMLIAVREGQVNLRTFQPTRSADPKAV